MPERYVLARIHISGEKFEILVKPDPALDYRMGKLKDVESVLVDYEVYTDARKGLRASSEKLRKCFGTTDIKKIAETILKQGELQITAEQRRRLIEEKRRQIIAFITKNCIDPRTGLPIPAIRVEQAMQQARVSIDPFKDADAQAVKVIEALRPILPLRVERVKLAIKVPPQYAPKMYGFIRSYGYLEREEWLSDGSWAALIDMPAGVQAEFLDKLSRFTKGSAQAKILK